MEKVVVEAKIQSPLVQPPISIAAWESFPKFVPFMENSVANLGTYTYDLVSKKISWNIIHKVRNIENVEEEITRKKIDGEHIHLSYGYHYGK